MYRHVIPKSQTQIQGVAFQGPFPGFSIQIHVTFLQMLTPAQTIFLRSGIPKNMIVITPFLVNLGVDKKNVPNTSTAEHPGNPGLATKRFLAPFRWWSRSMSNSTTFAGVAQGWNLETIESQKFTHLTQIIQRKRWNGGTSKGIARYLKKHQLQKGHFTYKFYKRPTNRHPCTMFSCLGCPAVPMANWAFWHAAFVQHQRSVQEIWVVRNQSAETC